MREAGRMSVVSIESIDEVRSLHRMLFKRKFLDGPNDEFFGSPHIASVQRTLFAALAAEDPDSWEKWAEARSHEIAITRFLDCAKCSSWWADADPESRRRFALDCLAPLAVDESLLDELVR